MSQVARMDPRRKRGDCEGSCDKTDVDIYLVHHNMWLCAECRDKEFAIIQQNNSVVKIIETSREIDSQIVLKTDILVAQTVPAMELRAAIDQDETIPQDQKDYRFTEECYQRYLKLKQVISEERKALQEKENLLRVWQTNTQATAGKLRADQREKYKELDFNYQPEPIKKQNKTTKVKTGKTPKFDKAAVMQAANKYKVPAHTVQIMVVTRKGEVTPEQAAMELARNMGLLQ